MPNFRFDVSSFSLFRGSFLSFLPLPSRRQRSFQQDPYEAL